MYVFLMEIDMRNNTLFCCKIMVCFLLFSTNAAKADMITVTDAEQYVGGGIGYKSEGVFYDVIQEYDPTIPPQGMGNADLGVSISDYDVTANALLNSLFGIDAIAVEGSANTSSEWSLRLNESLTEVYGGSVSSFLMNFSTDLSSVVFNINGTIEVSLSGYPDLEPKEAFVYVKLSTESNIVLWEEYLNGTDTETSRILSYSQILVPGQEYILEAFAGSGIRSTPNYYEYHARNSSFNLTAETNVVPVPGAVLLGGMGLSFSGWLLRRKGRFNPSS